MYPGMLSRAQMRNCRMQIYVRPETRRQCRFECVRNSAPTACHIDPITRQAAQQRGSVACIERETGTGGEQAGVKNVQCRRHITFFSIEQCEMPGVVR